MRSLRYILPAVSVLAIASCGATGEERDLKHLLEDIPQDSLHQALHNNHPAFQDGVYKEDHAAVEAVRADDPSLASKLVSEARVELVKRQNITTTEETTTITTTTTTTTLEVTTTTTTTEQLPTTKTTTTTTTTTPVIPTTTSVFHSLVPITTTQISTTRVSTSPSSPSPASIITTALSDSITEPSPSPTDTPTTDTDRNPQVTSTLPTTTVLPVVAPSSTTSTLDIVSDTAIAGSTTVTPSDSPLPDTTTVVPTTSPGGTRSPFPVSPESTTEVITPSPTIITQSSVVQVGTTTTITPIRTITSVPKPTTRIIAGVTTTDQFGNPIVLTNVTPGQVVTATDARGRVVTLTYDAAAKTVNSVVLSTRVLPNGSQSIVTATAVVVPNNTGGGSPNTAPGNGQTSPAPNPTLQTAAAARPTGALGREAVALLGGAVGFAMFL